MARTKKKKPRGWGRKLLLAGLAGVLVLVIFVLLTWPDVAALASENPRSTAFIDHARSQSAAVEWHWVAYDRISDDLKKAVVVSEDMSFFSHRGFDTYEIKRAAQDAARGKRVRGASTITQQLAKNLWLTPSKLPTRKLREIVLTRQLERHLTKTRILEIYLNVAQFGPEIYGADAAAMHFFGITAADLDADQSAQLAASLPRPSSWHPGVSSRGYLRAVSRIRLRAEQADWIDKLL